MSNTRTRFSPWPASEYKQILHNLIKDLYSFMNGILWTRKAVKQLLRLHGAHQVQIRDAVTLLGDMPDTGNVKALSGHTYA
ncbi:hypothetical protein EMIT0324P_80077 [Pseudomonas chlororaphis]